MNERTIGWCERRAGGEGEARARRRDRICARGAGGRPGGAGARPEGGQRGREAGGLSAGRLKSDPKNREIARGHGGAEGAGEGVRSPGGRREAGQAAARNGRNARPGEPRSARSGASGAPARTRSPCLPVDSKVIRKIAKSRADTEPGGAREGAPARAGGARSGASAAPSGASAAKSRCETEKPESERSAARARPRAARSAQPIRGS